MAPQGVAFLGVFLLAGVVLAAVGVRSLWTGYRIRSGGTAASTVDLVPGRAVDIEGIARAHERTLAGPFSGRDCLGYAYEVEEYHHDDDGSNWRTVDSGTETVPFLLELDRGTVFVDAGAATVDVADDRERTTVAGGSEPPERIAQFLADEGTPDSENRSLDLAITEVAYGDRRRYTEHALLPGETVYVSGVVRGATDAGMDLPRAASALVGPPGIDESESGSLPRLRRRLDPLTFYVADAPKGAAANRHLLRGGVLFLFGLLFAALPAVVLFGLL